MKNRKANIVFPLGGIDSSSAYQQQKPYTTVSAMNVRGSGGAEGRVRGGSRPGLRKSFVYRDSSGVPSTMSTTGIKLLNNVLAPSLPLQRTVRIIDSMDESGTDGNYWDDTHAPNTILDRWPERWKPKTNQDTIYEMDTLLLSNYGIMKLKASDEAVWGRGGAKFLRHSGATQTAPWLGTSDIAELSPLWISTIVGHDHTFQNSSLIDNCAYTIMWSVPNTGTINSGGCMYLRAIVRRRNSPSGWYGFYYRCEYYIGVINPSTGLEYPWYSWGTNKPTGYPDDAIQSHVVDFFGPRAVDYPGVFPEMPISIESIPVPQTDGTVNWNTRATVAGKSTPLTRSPVNLPSGQTRVGFTVAHRDYSSEGGAYPSVSGSRGGFHTAALRYTTERSMPEAPEETLVAAAASSIYIESSVPGTMEAMPSADAAATDGIEAEGQVSSAPYLGYLFVADHNEVVDRSTAWSDATMTSVGVLTDLGADFTKAASFGSHYRIDIMHLEGSAAAGDYRNHYGSYAFTINSPTQITLADFSATMVGLDENFTTVRYRIDCGPKKINVATRKIWPWGAGDPEAVTDGSPPQHAIIPVYAGRIPLGCTICSAYKDRMVLSGDPRNPGVIFMSRMANPYDWDFGAPVADAQRAVACGVQDSEVGGVVRPVTAIIPHSDDYMLIGCKNQLWVLRGDPASGGVIDNLSYSVGPLDQFSWAKSPSGTVWFLTANGVYVVPHGGASPPVAMSKTRMPNELQNISTEEYYINMGYALEDEGFYVFLSPKEAGRCLGFFYEETLGAWWPLELPDAMAPVVVHSYQPAVRSTKPDLQLGCRDGFVREFTDFVGDDDGTTIHSHVDIGPIPMGNGGILDSLNGELSSQSQPVAWAVRAGDTPQEAANALTDMASGVFSNPGLNYTARARVRGSAAYIRLSSDQYWALEGIQIDRRTYPKAFTRRR